MELEATELRECWAVKPKGQLGTCGWIDGIGWEVVFVKAITASAAISKALQASTRPPKASRHTQERVRDR